jgi:hypothetical protein
MLATKKAAKPDATIDTSTGPAAESRARRAAKKTT